MLDKHIEASMFSHASPWMILMYSAFCQNHGKRADVVQQQLKVAWPEVLLEAG
jgi:hypothetical protein